jgi:5-oxoprolinase (ATP-hydrolysing)
MRLGSTKGTNALLERKGAAVGLLITAGLGDLPEIGTQQRPHLFALHIQKPPRLYTRSGRSARTPRCGRETCCCP